jgi:hypothetical protein
MSRFVVSVGLGSQVLFDGELARVEELDAAAVTVRVERTGRFRVLTLSRLIADCTALGSRTSRCQAGASERRRQA